MKVVTVVGARPQFIKAAAVSRAIRYRELGPQVLEVMIHTGQHYDDVMSAAFFEDLGLAKPAYNLGVGSRSAPTQVAEMLRGLEQTLKMEQPALVVTYGDTNSTLAGALASAQLGFPSAHVEAGLRSYRRDMPEEINRLVADHLATLRFAPSQGAVENLRAEGISEGVVQTGDVMRDVFDWRLNRLGDTSGTPMRFGLDVGGYAVATVHRAENTDHPERLEAIVSALEELASHLPVLLPLHPRTRVALGDRSMSRKVLVIEPLPYGEMISLVRHARCVLTDSGGLQKEACWLGVPCVTLRTETEWPETVDCGWNVLADTDGDRIVRAALRDAPDDAGCDLYGDGHAAGRIVDALVGWFEGVGA